MTEVYPMTNKGLTSIETADHKYATEKFNESKIFVVGHHVDFDLENNTNERKRKENKVSIGGIESDKQSPIKNKTTDHDEVRKRRGSIYLNAKASSPNSASLETSENLESSLEMEKIEHERKSLARNKTFKAIIVSQDVEHELGNLIVDIILIILPCIVTVVPHALIPLHNPLVFPEYWYEAWIIYITVDVWQNLECCFQMAWCMNLSLPMRTRNLVISSFIISMFSLFFPALIIWIWTQVLGYHIPVPLSGYLIGLPTYVLTLLSTWFNFPLSWRENEKLKRRTLYFVLLLFYSTIIFKLQLQAVEKALTRNQNAYQIIISFLLPFIRELNLWVIAKLTEKAADGDLPGANIMAKFSLTSWYTVALCFILSSSTSTTTIWVLMGTDFAVNTILCIRIVWLKKKYPEDVDAYIHLIQELVVYELVEFLAPTVFLIMFALLAYGSNCHLIGNLCNGYWQFVPIQDIPQALLNLGTLCVVDILGTLLSSIILKAICKINILIVMKELIKEYKFAFCAVLGFRTSAVCKKCNGSFSVLNN